ncbi:SDR family oxidoreductase [Patiriisocius marinus]|uniref:Short-chain dehydrogenase n=1 Tax=Patiriisocius marinus TaxID=1397112 RepID=A0A5J4IWZ8_9FLAO|nr:SDR family oxidoreductase [Patiriisocius marinus]GER59456.1 short-chain dehydrogenase [Patiriisocius marinus]
MVNKTNKYALILGGSSGLGLATAHKLAKHGYNLILIYRARRSDRDTLTQEFELMKSHNVSVTAFNKDALKTEVINEILTELNDIKISVLVHSIAKGTLKPLLNEANQTLTKEDLDITIHAMGTSWWQWTRAIIDNNMFASDVRNIAFTSEGNNTVWQGYGAVSAAKVTLEALMRQMAIELAPLGIKTNCIQAGATQTLSFKMIPGNEHIAEMSLKRNPFNRMTTPEDVANSVYLLCKDEANWINGNVLKVDGGESLR